MSFSGAILTLLGYFLIGLGSIQAMQDWAAWLPNFVLHQNTILALYKCFKLWKYQFQCKLDSSLLQNLATL